MKPALKKWLPLGLFTALIVAADQITKALVRARIPAGAEIPVIPKVVCLTWVENSGAAFSMLSGMRWLFLALVAVFLVVVGLLIYKKVVTGTCELWCLAAIIGGALGNAVDRAVRGTVTDMIEPLFIDFAVFNVADSFITCGAIVLVVYVLFFDKEKAKK